MLSIESLKCEVLKAAKIERDLLPALREAERQRKVLADKAPLYRQQVDELKILIVNLDAEIRDGLAAGGDSSEKTISKRSALREKKAELEALAIEIEDVMLPAAQAKVADAVSKLHEALQGAVMIRRNALQDELNKQLEGIEAAMNLWNGAVWAVHSEFALGTTPFSGKDIALKNGTVRRALGF